MATDARELFFACYNIVDELSLIGTPEKLENVLTEFNQLIIDNPKINQVISTIEPCPLPDFESLDSPYAELIPILDGVTDRNSMILSILTHKQAIHILRKYPNKQDLMSAITYFSHSLSQYL